MNTFTGVYGGADSSGVTPIQLKIQNGEGAAGALSKEDHQNLLEFLTGRLMLGKQKRNLVIRRYANIDRLISTWQQLSPEDSQREQREELSGRNQAIPLNLPLLATHLDDLVSYFGEVFAPIAGNFYVSGGGAEATALAKKMNRDTKARSYYAELCLAFRSLIKYNIGGFHVQFERADTPGSGIEEPGNRWSSLDMYNTLWDPAVMDVTKVAHEGEWAATVEVKNRLWLLRKGLSGEYQRVQDVFECEGATGNRVGAKKTSTFYLPPPTQANLPADGADTRTSGNQKAGETYGSPIDWGAYGAALDDEAGVPIEGYEVVKMYCWLPPGQFGLLNASERQQMKALGATDDSFLELWQFTIVDASTIVDAMPVVRRDEAIQQAEASGVNVLAGGEIPIYIAHLTQDQMRQAQRSMMELMRGFQRFSSYLVNIYIAGMRKNIWGLKAIDPNMFDTSRLKQGDVAGVLESKTPGRDVRTGLHDISTTSGVDQAMNALAQTLELTKQFFPNQALPAQIASIDRAVKSQVSTVMQGATRKLNMLSRLIDSSLMMPARVGSYRNLKRWDSDGLGQLTSEEVAQVLGSGLESIAAERVADIMQNLIFALLQNPDSRQDFDISKMFSYLSRVMNLSTDLGEFAKAPQAAAGGEGAEGAGEGEGGSEGGESNAPAVDERMYRNLIQRV